MKTIKAISLVILLISSINLSAQKKREERKVLAKEQILKFKDGALLVRLQSRNQTIELLKSKGLPIRAEAMRKEQEEKNLKIAKGFKSFTFCPVYFFYNENSSLVKENKLKEILLDYDLNPVNVKDLKSYNIGVIGELPKNYTYQEVKEESKTPKGARTKKQYKGGSDLTVESFYLLDNEFNSLAKPFPSFQRYHPVILTTLSHEEVAKRMSGKLTKFYESKK